MKLLPLNTIPIKDSLLVRLGLAMGTIALLSFISITLSTAIADNSLGKANAINVAGSLRMMSYRLLSEAQDHRSQAQMQNQIYLFGERLNALEQFVTARSADYSELPTKFEQVHHRWDDQIEPQLIAAAKPNNHEAVQRLFESIPEFVNQIDQVVVLIEEDLERRIALLRSIQIVMLILTFIVGIVTMWMMKNQVVKPLDELLKSAKQLREKNFDTRVSHTESDELGQLGVAFNTMVEELARLYATQEQTIRDKTRELTNTNQSLELLYKSTLRLSDNDLSVATIKSLLKDIEYDLELGPGTICISENNTFPAHRLSSNLSAEDMAHLCHGRDCATCFNAADAGTGNKLDELGKMAFIPIQKLGDLTGVMPFKLRNGSDLPPWKQRALETIGRNLSIAMAKLQRQEERHRIAVLEERSVIARELHDSIAQSLSYLRIQVTRLQKNHLSVNDHNEVVHELKNGLASAYKELRELISAFRLRIDERGFQAALLETTQEFSKRCQIHISCQNDLSAMMLSANEEIHVLRIIRESLANIEKHAHATAVLIRASITTQEEIEIVVNDNGIGIGTNTSPEHHYGLIIMQDRAKSLNGQLTISNQPAGGTEVRLIFKPEKPLTPESHTKDLS